MFSKAKLKFDDIFENRLSSDDVKKYLVELYERGETAEEIASAASAMRDHMIPLNIEPKFTERLIDNCGTGGDKSNSFNVSTTVSILLAACGCFVAKHGNRSITSKSGSADMLEALGVKLDLSLDKQVVMLKETGFTFMFAQNHHPAMKHIMPIRKSLDHRTIFNILGPLSNPANVKKQLIGVFDKSYVPIIANALTKLHTKRAMVVSSADGMDEISISDVTYAAFVERGSVHEFIIDPREYGFDLYPKEDILGGDALENANITRGILSGEIKGAKKDIVLINTAAALLVEGWVSSTEEGIEMARDAINDGKALEKLEEIIKVSNEL
ncbi:MAG TPA: anthranilate phosphoribosyltransferase [Arcobacter sp.]|nr:anthranilate phosphoribosyltransferase [Arcobacter sp.]HIP56012.1 anthranilate phosphoribosyltransferase [Arcobacter sp.]